MLATFMFFSKIITKQNELDDAKTIMQPS